MPTAIRRTAVVLGCVAFIFSSATRAQTPDAGRIGCAPVRCTPPAPPATARSSFHHERSRLIASLGHPRHRGVDTLARAGTSTWAIARFEYGANHASLRDEQVEVYLLRDCVRWERIATAVTTDEHAQPDIEGVPDTGGRVYVPMPVSLHLDPGLHDVLFVVIGDLTTTMSTIDVLPDDPRYIVSDVDGTLTRSENAIVWSEAHLADEPTAHPGGPEALAALAARGYAIVYLTARPEWMSPRTHEWLASHGFPPGAVITSHTHLGVVGNSAQDFKSRVLASLAARFGRPALAFGNRASDVEAYGAAGIDAAHCYYYQLGDDLHGGHRVDDYRTLVSTFASAPSFCH